jgi:hypothetical protein
MPAPRRHSELLFHHFDISRYAAACQRLRS